MLENVVDERNCEVLERQLRLLVKERGLKETFWYGSGTEGNKNDYGIDLNYALMREPMLNSMMAERRSMHARFT